MVVDTSHTVEIEASPVKLLGLAVLGIIMTALSTAVAIRAFPNIRPGSSAEFYGYIGIVLFGASTCLCMWRAFTMHSPVVIITRAGIRDKRVAKELIPWGAVKNISVWKHHRQRCMVLTVDPAVEAGLNLTRVVRWSRNANRALGVDGLCINATGLKIGFDELLAISLAFARA